MEQKNIRWGVHIMMSVVLLIVITLFKSINYDSVIKELFIYAGYTYGPLLGMFAFGFFIKRDIIDKAMPFIAIGSPIITALIKSNSELIFNGYKIGFELLLINGLITILFMLLFSKKSNVKSSVFV